MSAVKIMSIVKMECGNNGITVVMAAITLYLNCSFIVVIIPISFQQIRLVIFPPLDLLVIFPLLTGEIA